MTPELLLKHFERITDAVDAVPRLRRFILDLAVQGRLVKQDPNEEAACELLKRINSEKARLLKQGDIKKLDSTAEPPTSEFPYPMPSGWAISSLQALCISVTDGDHLPPPKADQGIPFLVIGNVRSRTLDFAGCRHVAKQYYDELDAIRRPQKGDILYTLVGSYGIPVLITDTRQFCVQRHIGILRPSLIVDARFLTRILESRWVFDQATACATGIAQKTVPLSGLRQMLIPLPPLAEQRRIVVKVDELMTLCDQLEVARDEREKIRDRLSAASVFLLSSSGDSGVFRQHANFHIDHLHAFTARPHQINRLRQNIRNLAVRGYLVPQDPDDEPASDFLKRIELKKSDNGPFRIPGSWAWISVGQIGEARLGKMLDKAKNKGTPRRYLRNVNVRWFDFDLSDIFEMRFEDDEIEEFALRNGDVLICEGGEPGRSAVWDEREKKIYFQKAIHRVRFPQGIDSHFFVTALRESADSGRLLGYFTGVGIKHFTGKGLSSFLFPLAPLAEQHRIVARVNELMALCDRLEAQLSNVQHESGRLLESVLYHTLNNSMQSKELISALA